MTQYVSPEATIHPTVEIGPFTVISADVEIGEGTRIGSHVVILDGVRIGNHCQIFTGAVLGTIPQDKKYSGEQALLIIGDHVVVREYCTLNIGTEATGHTLIGNSSLLMAYVHVAHDCQIGNHVVLANNVNLAGHVSIGDHAILGGLVAVHQFTSIGKYSMIGGGTLVRKDVPPFVKAAREPISYAGVNSVGLKRGGYDQNTIHHIQDMYRILFVKGYGVNKAIQMIQKEIEDSEYKSYILECIEQSKRGIIRGLTKRNVH